MRSSITSSSASPSAGSTSRPPAARRCWWEYRALPRWAAPRPRGARRRAGAAPDRARRGRGARLLAALGERANVRELEALAHTRLRIRLADPGRFDEAAAKRAGVAAVMRAAPGVLHLIVGEQAGPLAAAMQLA